MAVKELNEDDENFPSLATGGFHVSKQNNLVEDDFELLISKIDIRFDRVGSLYRSNSKKGEAKTKEEVLSVSGEFKAYLNNKKYCQVHLALGQPYEGPLEDGTMELAYSIEQPDRPVYGKILGILFFSIIGISAGILIWLLFRHYKTKQKEIIAPIDSALRLAISGTFEK